MCLVNVLSTFHMYILRIYIKFIHSLDYSFLFVFSYSLLVNFARSLVNGTLIRASLFDICFDAVILEVM